MLDTRISPSKAASHVPVAEPRIAAPVKWWAAIGAIVVVFMIFTLTRWITGSLFETMPDTQLPSMVPFESGE